MAKDLLANEESGHGWHCLAGALGRTVAETLEIAQCPDRRTMSHRSKM
jgi:hypothetical protein